MSRRTEIKCISKGDHDIYLSIVIPVYNEKTSIAFLYDELTSALEKINKTYEVILVDDGSRDGTFEELLKLHEKNCDFRIVRFRRNFGQTPAMAAGFDISRGEIIVTLDADLQNDPADIPLLLEKIEEGNDIVSGWRTNRQDKALSRRLPSVIANKLIGFLTGVRIHDYGCTLKAYRSEIIKNIDLYGEMHRYIPAVASWLGVTVSEVSVNHRARKYGKSKYGISRTIRVILDIIFIKYMINYSQRPIQIFGLIGLITGGIGSILTLYLIIMRLFFEQALASRPLFTLSIFMIFIGVQLITMGIIAELIMRTYHEAQNKPTYAIKEIIG